MPRFSDIPVLETVLLDRKDLPSAGAGETPIVGLAPAVGNAIFHATGIRIRSLPMIPKGMPSQPQSTATAYLRSLSVRRSDKSCANASRSCDSNVLFFTTSFKLSIASSSLPLSNLPARKSPSNSDR